MTTVDIQDEHNDEHNDSDINVSQIDDYMYHSGFFIKIQRQAMLILCYNIDFIVVVDFGGTNLNRCTYMQLDETLWEHVYKVT